MAPFLSLFFSCSYKTFYAMISKLCPCFSLFRTHYFELFGILRKGIFFWNIELFVFYSISCIHTKRFKNISYLDFTSENLGGMLQLSLSLIFYVCSCNGTPISFLVSFSSYGTSFSFIFLS